MLVNTRSYHELKKSVLCFADTFWVFKALWKVIDSLVNVVDLYRKMIGDKKDPDEDPYYDL